MASASWDLTAVQVHINFSRQVDKGFQTVVHTVVALFTPETVCEWKPGPRVPSAARRPTSMSICEHVHMLNIYIYTVYIKVFMSFYMCVCMRQF